VDDLISGIYALMMSDLNDPVNLGNPQEDEILDIAKNIIASTDSKSVVSFKPLPPDDPKLRCPDIAKAKTFLKWSPKIPLERGLKETIAYFKASA